jgi:hypothetical protein
MEAVRSRGRLTVNQAGDGLVGLIRVLKRPAEGSNEILARLPAADEWNPGVQHVRAVRRELVSGPGRPAEKSTDHDRTGTEARERAILSEPERESRCSGEHEERTEDHRVVAEVSALDDDAQHAGQQESRRPGRCSSFTLLATIQFCAEAPENGHTQQPEPGAAASQKHFWTDLSHPLRVERRARIVRKIE